MKKKLLSLILSPLVALQGAKLVSVNAMPDKTIPKAPRLMPQTFDCKDIEPISLGPGHAFDFFQFGKLEKKSAKNKKDSVIKRNSTLSSTGFITQKDQIRSRIGDNFVFVYTNQDIPFDTPMVIFRSPSGKYIGYRSITPEHDDRDKIVSCVEKLENTDTFDIDHLLFYAINVMLESN